MGVQKQSASASAKINFMRDPLFVGDFFPQRRKAAKTGNNKGAKAERTKPPPTPTTFLCVFAPLREI
jgi:hypothetical protein